jgi:hypothetical protein
VIRISYSQVAAAFSNASRSLAENGERDNTSVAMRFCVASDFLCGLLAFAMHGK